MINVFFTNFYIRKNEINVKNEKNLFHVDVKRIQIQKKS